MTHCSGTLLNNLLRLVHLLDGFDTCLRWGQEVIKISQGLLCVNKTDCIGSNSGEYAQELQRMPSKINGE
jgi:hypothetical protein